MLANLTPKQKELLELVALLGREKFAPRAERYDREASFPFENYADLRERSISLALCIPTADGGWGADFQTYCLVAAELARYCSTTTLTLNMHCATTMWIGKMVDDLNLPSDVQAVHAARRAALTGGSSKLVRSMPSRFPKVTRRQQESRRLLPLPPRRRRLAHQRAEDFCFSLRPAIYYVILATEDKPELRPATHFFSHCQRTGRLSIVGDWDPLGMRGTVSRTLLMNNVFVPDELQLMPRGVYHQLAVQWPHMFLTLTPSYLGLPQAIFDFTVAYLRGEVPPMREKRRKQPLKQAAVAEMKIMFETSRALFLAAIAEAGPNPSKEARLRAYAMQYTVMENVNRLAALAVRTCGGQSILRPLPLERMYRDSRCGSLMLPWTAELCIERLGRECLYEPGERDE